MDQERLYYLSILFYIIFGFYFAALLVGFYLGSTGKVKPKVFTQARNYLADPLTASLHKKLTPHKEKAIRERKWLRFFLLIFFNNLVLAGFIGHTLYGIIFYAPLLLTIWSGLGRGVISSGLFNFSRKIRSGEIPFTEDMFPGGKIPQTPEEIPQSIPPIPRPPFNPRLVGVFEFGGYLFASIAGMNLGSSFFMTFGLPPGQSFIRSCREMGYIYIIVAGMLLVGAILETLIIRSFPVPKDKNMIQKGKEMLEKMWE